MSQHREHFRSDQVPDGKYPVKVLAADIGPWSQANQDDRWQLELEIMSGEYQGRRLWYKVGMSEKATGYRRGTLTALGINWRDHDVDLIDEVIGKHCDAEIVYNADYDRAEVKRLRSQKSDVAPGQTDIGELPEIEIPDNCPF